MYSMIASDSDMVQRALTGDQEAFAILVDRYRKSLLEWVYRFVRDFHLANDIVQDVFLQLYISLGSIDLDSSLKAWLFKVARNRSIDRLRRKRPILFSELDTGHEEDELAAPLMLPDTSPLPEELAERHDLQLYLHKTIQTLPAKYRVVVFLRYEDEMSFRSIGLVLHIPETTAKTHYYRAKRLLRAALEAESDSLLTREVVSAALTR